MCTVFTFSAILSVWKPEYLEVVLHSFTVLQIYTVYASDRIMDDFYEECILISSRFVSSFEWNRKPLALKCMLSSCVEWGVPAVACLHCWMTNWSRSSRIMELWSLKHVFCWRPGTNESCLLYVVLFAIEQGEKYGSMWKPTALADRGNSD